MSLASLVRNTTAIISVINELTIINLLAPARIECSHLYLQYLVVFFLTSGRVDDKLTCRGLLFLMPSYFSFSPFFHFPALSNFSPRCSATFTHWTVRCFFSFFFFPLWFSLFILHSGPTHWANQPARPQGTLLLFLTIRAWGLKVLNWRLPGSQSWYLGYI